jgi:hypothetical protein
MMDQDFDAGGATRAEITQLAEEQNKNDPVFRDLYGKYTLGASDCGDVTAYFEEHSDQNGHKHGCGMVGVWGSSDYWRTTWKRASDSAQIKVYYTSTRPNEGNYAASITTHGSEGNDPGWDSMTENYHLKTDLIVRSALNSLCVNNMVLTKGNDIYDLYGAHRLNFNYHKSMDTTVLNEDTKLWGFHTHTKYELLRKMRDEGLATTDLFDPLGLVWLLLWKKGGSGEPKYHVCAAYMHPHFADLINGTLPEDYNVCTATRWWNTVVDKDKWFNGKYNPNLNSSHMMNYITAGNKTWWVADKIRKPFFRISGGAIEVSQEVQKAMNAEDERLGSSNSTRPLKRLIDILMYVYFDKKIETPTPKPQVTEKPGTNGTNGTEVTTVTTVTTGNSGNSGNLVTTGANDPAVVTVTTSKPPADDASKEAGTGTVTPVPTGTGTPAKEESFWDKNQYYIIGGIIGGLFLLLVIVAFIFVSRRRDLARTEAGYDQLGYSDPGSEYPLESLGEGPEGRGEGPEDLGEGTEGLELEGLGGEETGPTRFGF